MANTFFRFKNFTIHQEMSAMKVTTDACLFGAWVAEKIALLKNRATLLDVGTGTGLLSLMIIQKHPEIKIDAVEIDRDAFLQSTSNFGNSPWANSLNAIHADISTMEIKHNYNIVISNPPFYENELKSPDPKRKLAHHSGLSLNALVSIIKKTITPEGDFFLLLPYKRISEIRKIISDHALHINELVLVKQTPTHNPFRILLHGSATESKTNYAEKEMTIKNETGQYSATFSQLIRDYYL